MALAIDSSTPLATSISNVGTTTTTGTFSPPANSVIFVMFAMVGTTSPQLVTNLTDSLGTPLAWSLFNNARDNVVTANLRGTAEVWWAPCPSAQTNMTITATYSTANSDAATVPAGMIQIVVFTGASALQNGAASIRNDGTLTATPSQSLITTIPNSWVIGIVQNWTNGTGPTVGTNQTTTFNGNSGIVLNTVDGDAYWAQRQNATTATAPTSVTLNDTAPTSIAHHFAMVEVVSNTIAPVVTTQAVTAVAPTTATGNGTVVSDGNDTITERGVCWSTSANPTTADSKATAAGTTGAYTVSITGLSDNTLYHARAYAINSLGTSYGIDVTFKDYPVSSAWHKA